MAASGSVVRFSGFPELRARLASVAQAGPEILARWQQTTRDRARSTAPSRTGRGRSSIHAAEVTSTRAVVRGAYWLIFIDRGTKPHDIEPKGVTGSGRGGKSTTRFLKFDYKGKTVFARRVHRRRMRRRPFLSQAANQAFRENFMAEEVIGLWNRRAKTRRWTKARAVA